MERVMRLSKLSVENFRSIKSAKQIRIEPLQSFIGENNSGKSNFLRSIECFLSPGAGGVEIKDFNDPIAPVFIECEFIGLSDIERKRLRRYLLGDKVILRKELKIVTDPVKGKSTVKAEYHGYQAEPTAVHLSIEKIERKGGKTDWQQLAKQGGFLDYALTSDGKVNKSSFRTALDRFLLENDVEYDQPTVGATQALGIPQNLLSALPEFYLLPAITDYSDEIDRRSSSTVFRKLMSDLSERLLSVDPRYKEIEDALNRIRALLNVQTGEGIPRLGALAGVEERLRNILKGLMPSVQGISLSVDVEESKDIFSKGVSIKIDDGVLTDVLDKGHGMQRSLVFALLQMLIQSSRNNGDGLSTRPILLAIEEPELYIHPHSQRLIFNVLKEFSGIKDVGEAAGNDQVIYTTHSPAFIEIGNYERIAVVRKSDRDKGTVVQQCPEGILGNMEEKKGFKLLTSFGLKHNELFFSRNVILVEGPEDEVGIIATARKLGRIKDLPDEIGLSIVITDGKGDIPKFQKVLNAFKFEYGVLIELDGNPESHGQTAPILEQLNGNRVATVPKRIEGILNVGKHFDDLHHAKKFFSDPMNINSAMEDLVRKLLPEL